MLSTKEKVLGIARFIYLILLLAVLVMMFISIFTNTADWLLFVYIFVGVLVIGYIIITILNMFTYKYICPDCKSEKNMNFFEAVFSTRGNNERLLKCPKCNEKKIMERVNR